MGEERHLLTTQEVATLLRVHPETVRDWIRKGELPALSFGRRSGHRIRKTDLDAFMEARAISPKKPSAQGEQPGTADEAERASA